MKAFVMALGLVAITTAPVLAQRGTAQAGVQQPTNPGQNLLLAQFAGTPRLEMVADTWPHKIDNGVTYGVGTRSPTGAATRTGHIQWQFDPPAGFYLGGN